jgi:4a-hydroxytetrahydrobiopterin dehydratase
MILSQTEIDESLVSLPGWTYTKGSIEKTFVFRDFKEALGFIVQIGILAEQADHHPEMVNVYNKVILRLHTHSESAITEKDILLAQAINHQSEK